MDLRSEHALVIAEQGASSSSLSASTVRGELMFDIPRVQLDEAGGILEVVGD